MDPQALCRSITTQHPDLPVIVLTPGADLDTAIAALRARASDCVIDPRDATSVITAVGRALERAALREQLYQLRSQQPRATTRSTSCRRKRRNVSRARAGSNALRARKRRC